MNKHIVKHIKQNKTKQKHIVHFKHKQTFRETYRETSSPDYHTNISFIIIVKHIVA